MLRAFKYATSIYIWKLHLRKYEKYYSKTISNQQNRQHIRNLLEE